MPSTLTSRVPNPGSRPLHSLATGFKAALAALLLLAVGRLAAQAPYGLSTRGTVGPFLNNVMPSTAPVTAGNWTTVNAFPGLGFQDPTFLASEPGTTLLFVCGREGQIWSFQNNPNVTAKTLVLDLSAHCQGWNDSGLLSMAFHPQFGQAGSPNRGYIYVYYSYTPGPVVGSAASPPDNYTTLSYNRLSRFTIPDGSSVADPNSELVLINQFDRDLWHNGGGMFFGADGFLYLSNGDEGGADDQYNQTQKINSGLFSGVLRIDVNEDPTKSHPIRRQPQSGAPPPAGWPASYSQNYYIPNDNPWQDPSGGTLEEFWAIGLRSPHRMTQDPVTGLIWLGDVGQAAWEELDLIQKAGNYQWAYMEGDYTGFIPRPSPLIGIDSPPIYDYNHSTGDTCVIGGYVYHGTQFAAQLGGQYIYGDNTSNRIYSVVLNGSNAPTVTYLASLPPGEDYTGGISTFGLDANNELYMCTMGANGSIYKLQLASASTAAIPALLSQTGAFSNLAALTPAAGIVPYNVNTPLWSDGASKGRWIALPSGTTIPFASTGEWSFPPGTVLIKNFEVSVSDVNPSLTQLLETRMIVFDANGSAYGVTYKWRADGSDADLLVGSVSQNISIATASGTRTQTWYFPSRQDCLSCHNPNAGFALGIKSRQLNGNFAYPSTGITDNQLRTWSHIGMFSAALNEAQIPTYPALSSVTDTTASLETRVRSYLDANCAQCHRPNGVEGYWDARFDTPIASQGILNGPLATTLGIPDVKVISPGNINESMIYLRMNVVGANQMPPLARNTVDQQAVATLTSYINSLAPAPFVYAGPDQGVVPGSTVTLQGSASGLPSGTSPTYTWSQVIGPQVTLANSSSLSPSFAPPSSGTFAFALTAQAGSFVGTSDPVMITVGPIAAPITSSLPGDQTVGAGQTTILSIEGVGNPAPTFQWYNNGIAIAGATQPTLLLSNVQLSNSGNYTVVATNSAGSFTSSTEVLTVDALATITSQPQSTSVGAGSPVTLSVGATGTPPLSYQWYQNGTAIVGAVSASYTIGSVQPSNTGNYTVTVTDASGSVNSAAAALVVAGALPGHLSNLSGRTTAGTGSQTLIAGFTVSGSGSLPLLVRGIGPGLAQFGVTGTVADPQLQVFNSASAVIGSNDNWSSASNATAVVSTSAAVGAFALASGSADAALLGTFAPGSYTVQITGNSGSTGTALAEVYDATPTGTAGLATLVNFSLRTQVGTGSNILIAGFVIAGNTAETLLIRGVGPTLTQFGVTGVLAAPQLQIYNSTGTVVAQSAAWGANSNAAAIASAQQSVGAFALPTGSADAALLVTLAPGAYTAQVSGIGATTGVGLVEVYAVANP